MSDVPVPERIALLIISRLEEITVSNGYLFNVSDVTRVNRDVEGWTPRNLSIVIKQGPEIENDQMTHEGNPAAIAYDVLFSIHGFVRHPERSPEGEIDDKTSNELAASIKKAIVANQHDWHNFDGNAIDARWTGTQPYLSPQGDHAGITVGLSVTYRISETNPFEARA